MRHQAQPLTTGCLSGHRPCATRAFTLVELLIVIGVIGILISIVLTIGARVVQGGKVRLTEQTIRILDMTIEAMISDQGVLPSALVADPRDVETGDIPRLIPIADARDHGSSYQSGQPGQPPLAGHQMINSVGLLLLQAERVPSAATVSQGIDARMIKRWDADYADDIFGAGSGGAQPTLATVFDAWNRPLRYVHPQFDGLIYGPDYMGGQVSNPAQEVSLNDILGPAPSSNMYGITAIRRNNRSTGTGSSAEDLPDSDGGVCPSNTPYFYSAGPDGDPSTTDDNVYTIIPTLPKS